MKKTQGEKWRKGLAQERKIQNGEGKKVRTR